MESNWIWWIVGGIVTGFFTMVARASYPYLAREASYRISQKLLQRIPNLHPASAAATGINPYSRPYSWLFLVWKWLNGLP